MRIFKVVAYAIVLLASVPFAFSLAAVVRERGTAAELAPETGTFIQAGDTTLFVQTAGDSRNTPVLLVHGMAAWSGTWRQTMESLAQRNYYAVAVDSPPFGFSARPMDRSYWRVSQAKRLASLVRALKLERPILVAHSYGSRAAFEFAMRHPELLRALVVVDPALDGIYESRTASSPILSGLLSIDAIRYGLVASTMTNPFLARTLLEQFMHRKEAATDAVLAVYRRPGGLRGSTRDFGYWLLGFLDGADIGRSSERENFAAVEAPVAIIWGREDTTTPLSQGEALRTYLPNAALTVMDGVGHMPHIEDPGTFNDVLLRAIESFQLDQHG